MVKCIEHRFLQLDISLLAELYVIDASQPMSRVHNELTQALGRRYTHRKMLLGLTLIDNLSAQVDIVKVQILIQIAMAAYARHRGMDLLLDKVIEFFTFALQHRRTDVLGAQEAQPWSPSYRLTSCAV